MSPVDVSSLVRRVAVVTLVVATASVASAASLGGADADQLAAWTLPAEIDDGYLACADFTGIPDNGPIHGHPAGCGGGPWTSNGGNWHVVGGQLKANTSASTVTIPGPSPYLSAVVSVIGANQSNRVGGVLVSYHAATSSYLAAVIVGPNRVELRVVTAGSSTVLASVTTPVPATARLRLTRTSSTATVMLDTTTVISVPFASTLLTGTGAGIYHGGGPSVSFDDFQLTLAGS